MMEQSEDSLIQVKLEVIPQEWADIHDPEGRIWVEQLHDDYLVICRKEEGRDCIEGSRWRFEVRHEGRRRWRVAWISPGNYSPFDAQAMESLCGSRDAVVDSLNGWLWCHQRFEHAQGQISMRVKELRLSGQEAVLSPFPKEGSELGYYLLAQGLASGSMHWALEYKIRTAPHWRLHLGVVHQKGVVHQNLDTADEAMDRVQEWIDERTR